MLIPQLMENVNDIKEEGDDTDVLYEDDDRPIYDERHDSTSDDEVEEIFKPRKLLPPPKSQKYKIKDLMNILDVRQGTEGVSLLDLEPEYQRDVVWNQPQMSALVNSIIENYYVPPLIFNVVEITIDGINYRKRVCVDGKQRLSSVRAFTKGEIPCHDLNGGKWYFDHKNGAEISRRRHVWPKKNQEDFKAKEFLCYEYEGLTPEQEEDLFARVQKGIPLNPAEKLRATSGPWQDLAKRFEVEFTEVVNLCVGKAVQRAGRFRLMLACFAQIIEVQHPTNADGVPRLKATAIPLKTFTDNGKALDDKTKSHIVKVFTKFRDLIRLNPRVFGDNEYTVVKTFSPLEMVGVAVLLSMYNESRNLQMLSGDVKEMRRTLRSTFHDLKLNPHCWSFMWKFIDDLEAYRGVTIPETIYSKNDSMDMDQMDGIIERPLHTTLPAQKLQYPKLHLPPAQQPEQPALRNIGLAKKRGARISIGGPASLKSYAESVNNPVQTIELPVTHVSVPPASHMAVRTLGSTVAPESPLLSSQNKTSYVRPTLGDIEPISHSTPDTSQSPHPPAYTNILGPYVNCPSAKRFLKEEVWDRKRLSNVLTVFAAIPASKTDWNKLISSLALFENPETSVEEAKPNGRSGAVLSKSTPVLQKLSTQATSECTKFHEKQSASSNRISRGSKAAQKPSIKRNVAVPHFTLDSDEEEEEPKNNGDKFISSINPAEPMLQSEVRNKQLQSTSFGATAATSSFNSFNPPAQQHGNSNRKMNIPLRSPEKSGAPASPTPLRVPAASMMHTSSSTSYPSNESQTQSPATIPASQPLQTQGTSKLAQDRNQARRSIPPHAQRHSGPSSERNLNTKANNAFTSKSRTEPYSWPPLASAVSSISGDIVDLISDDEEPESARLNLLANFKKPLNSNPKLSHNQNSDVSPLSNPNSNVSPNSVTHCRTEQHHHHQHQPPQPLSSKLEKKGSMPSNRKRKASASASDQKLEPKRKGWMVNN